MSGMDPSYRPQVGDVVDDKYELVKLLGEGGFGVVFEAKHRLLQDKFALKFYLPKGDHGPMERERFIREARAARRIKSEYSVLVSDMGSFVKSPGRDELLYIVMEYLEGENLYEFACRQQPLPVPVVIDYILQACIALAKAHAMKITHRDLKPSNLFLTHQDGLPRVKVLDFGLAKDASPAATPGSQETQTGQIIGTLAYMPPEQLRGLRYATPLTDIFALGVCLYFLLTLNEPFPGDEAADIIVNISTRPPIPMRSFRPDLPQNLVNVIERSLSKKPEDRQQAIVEFARELVHFGAPIAARWMTMIEGAAAAGALAAEKMEEEKPTVKLARSAPPNDPTTIPLQRQAATIPLARPMPPPAQPTPSSTPRKTNSRVVVGVTAGALTLAIVIGISLNQCASTTALPPVNSAAPSAKPVVPVPSDTPHPIPTPSSTPSASASAQPPGPKKGTVDTKKKF